MTARAVSCPRPLAGTHDQPLIGPESLFNILRHGIGFQLEDARVMDLFAGSGALGLEALSRGAEACIFIDRAQSAKKCIEDNLTALALTDRGGVLKLDAAHLPARSADVAPAHLAFIDPPYGQGLAPTTLTSLQQGEWLAEKALIVVETGKTEDLARRRLTSLQISGPTARLRSLFYKSESIHCWHHTRH